MKLDDKFEESTIKVCEDFQKILDQTRLGNIIYSYLTGPTPNSSIIFRTYCMLEAIAGNLLRIDNFQDSESWPFQIMCCLS